MPQSQLPAKYHYDGFLVGELLNSSALDVDSCSEICRQNKAIIAGKSRKTGMLGARRSSSGVQRQGYRST